MTNDPNVQAVFEGWKNRRPNPSLLVLTEAREAIIKARLREHTVEQLLLLIEYAHEATTGETRFWQGENDNKREYLDLTNLLIKAKTAQRVENAYAWKHGLQGAPKSVGSRYETEEVPDLNLGWRGRMQAATPGLPPAKTGQPVIGRVVRR